MQLAEVKERVNLHDLAERLGLERPDPAGNYRSPHHKDKNPSLSIYIDKHSGEEKWKDHSSGEGGDCFDLVCYVERCENGDAIKRIRELYSLPYERQGQPRQELSTIEYIAQQCQRETDAAVEYLRDKRAIDEEVIKRAIQRRSLGFSIWTSAKKNPGELGYGGAAVAFICKDIITSQVVGIDYRYIDPALNGDLKTKSQGEKSGVVWTSCLHTLKRARTVVVCESAINALSVETAIQKTGVMKGWAALAIRGTENHDIDWSPLIGKRVIICMDNDPVIQEGPRKGESPGRMAAWRVVDQLTKKRPSAVIAVSRLIRRASGRMASRISSASPHGYEGGTGRGIGPLAVSASST